MKSKLEIILRRIPRVCRDDVEFYMRRQDQRLELLCAILETIRTGRCLDPADLAARTLEKLGYRQSRL